MASSLYLFKKIHFPYVFYNSKVLNTEHPLFCMIIGLFVGDAHLANRTPTKKTYYLMIEQSSTKIDYVIFIYNFLKNFIPEALSKKPRKMKMKERNGKVRWNLGFSTKIHPFFSELGSFFYQKKKKGIPPEIKGWLTPESLAFWYLDDGSSKSKESNRVFF